MCHRVWSSVATCLSIVVLLWFHLPATTAASDDPAGGVLHLTNSGFLPGELLGSDDPNVLRWSSPFFTEPFLFPMDAVSAVHHESPSVQPKPTGEYCFELVNDDTLYGELLGLTDESVELETAWFGRVQVRRAHVRRIYRWQGEELVYLGPNGLADWKKSPATAAWRDEGGLPATDESGASLFGEFEIPAQAAIEFELSWKRKPDFLFALGVDDQAATVQQAFRFEVWDSDLVVLGESSRDADVASVQLVRAGPGRVHAKAYLDQEEQRLLLFSRRGQAIAAFDIRSKKPQVHAGLRLTNKKGDVRLESLRISRWNGVPPREVCADQSRIHRTDGSIVYGQLVAFDPESKQFAMRDRKSETLVDADAIADVYLSPISDASTASSGSVTDTSKRTLRATYQNGSRLSGELQRVDETHLLLISPGMKEPLRLPLTGLRSLIALQHGKRPAAPSLDGKPGRLEMEGVRLKGRLANGSEQPDASCLVWHPDQSLNASPLHLGVAGRIVYRDRPTRRRTTAAPQTRRKRRPAGIGGFLQRLVTGTAPAERSTAPARSRRSLHLRSGDTIPCEVTSIDEEGVTFKTPISEATFVPHEVVKAIELGTTRSSPRLNKIQRNRLLTVPRLLKDSPPTHLICSKNGDFLRARLLAMDDKRLQVEVRLETKELPRDRIIRVIWLHEDELTGEVAKVAAGSSQATRVQTLRADGNRLTFLAQKLDNNMLTGESEFLGACQANLDQVDQLLFGAFIEQAAARLIYHRWKLHHATEPKFAQFSDGEAMASQPSGTESPLVGQPAPDVELNLLDGGKFRLADHKGRVVVLDFWATWCGPCLQTMPLVDGVVREFAGQGVELIAINLEEQPKQITSMLERHKLTMSVALDHDGVAAARYHVTAIPQTVVIDREGRVARLYVGGGPKLADPLRDVLHELSEAETSPATSP